MRVETPAEKILFCTVRLETQGPEPHLMGAGTSFIFSLQTSTGPFPCLVTNKHVIKGAQTARLFFTEEGDSRKPHIGKRFDIRVDNFEAKWYGHPDPETDVAAMPLGPLLNNARRAGHEIFYSYIDQDQIPTTQQLEELDVLEEIVFVGYPNGIFDSVNLLPVFRRGITATPPQIDHGGNPIFLVDASVFPGSSGSPVFIYNLGGYMGRRGLRSGTRLFFLGIIAKVAYREEQGTLEFISIPTAQVPIVKTRQMIDLGVVFKARAVFETVQGLLSSIEAQN